MSSLLLFIIISSYCISGFGAGNIHQICDILHLYLIFSIIIMCIHFTVDAKRSKGAGHLATCHLHTNVHNFLHKCIFLQLLYILAYIKHYEYNRSRDEALKYKVIDNSPEMISDIKPATHVPVTLILYMPNYQANTGYYYPMCATST